MNDKFDELTKSMAQSVTRRAALKKFGAGLAGMALACFGLANKAHAVNEPCEDNKDCPKPLICCKRFGEKHCTYKGLCKPPQF